jgi:hypothetical protein
MRSIFVVVKNVLVQQALQMPFIQHDHMVEQITTAAADPTLANTVLPWTSETGPLFGWMPRLFIVLTTSSLKLAPRFKDQVARRRVIGECLTQLLNNPGTARMLGHVAVKDTPSIMREDEEAVKHAEGERRHGEEIHCSNRFTMVFQNATHRFAGSEFRGALFIQRNAP